jgi:hypothetical protein
MTTKIEYYTWIDVQTIQKKVEASTEQRARLPPSTIMGEKIQTKYNIIYPKTEFRSVATR